MNISFPVYLPLFLLFGSTGKKAAEALPLHRASKQKENWKPIIEPRFWSQFWVLGMCWVFWPCAFSGLFLNLFWGGLSFSDAAPCASRIRNLL